MAVNTFKCNYLTPLQFKGLNQLAYHVWGAMLEKYVCVTSGPAKA